MEPVRVGVIGCGTISGIYLTNMPKFEVLEVVAVADLIPERAASAAAEYEVGRACSVDELLADDSIEIVVNLTTPQDHYGVTKSTLEAGKHVHTEKPLTVALDEAREILNIGEHKNLRVGNAPDTFLGAGIQTCRELIDQGRIGEPVSAAAFMTNHGHEWWHPAPAFYYQAGGGPMFDMGPYYLTALVNLMGPIAGVSGITRATYPERLITSEPLAGIKVPVETPTHIAGLLNFANGAIGNIITSFDVWAARLPHIEIYGSEGSLSVPDPNTFGGPVRVWQNEKAGWEDVPVTRPFVENSRGVGVADMATAIRSGRAHRASGDVGLHTLEVMHALHESSDAGRYVDLTTGCEQPTALPTGLAEFQLDD